MLDPLIFFAILAAFIVIRYSAVRRARARYRNAFINNSREGLSRHIGSPFN